MADESQVKELEVACAAIVELLPKKASFISRSEWGEINFESVKSDMENVFWIVGEVDKLPTHVLPENIVSNSVARLSEIKNMFEQIDTFSIAHGDPSGLRDNIAINFKQQIQTLMSEIGIWLPVLALRAGEIQNWASQVEDTSAQATFTHEFREEAVAVEKRSKCWLWPTGIFSVLALALSVLLMFGLLGDAPDNVWEAVYGLGGRVIAISVLFYAAVWSGRVVLANMHLASVNKHRAVSLQTLQAFHKAAEDSAAKDAVVLEAARAVYENVPSGYIGRQAAGQGTGARTLEVIRGADKAPRPDDGG